MHEESEGEATRKDSDANARRWRRRLTPAAAANRAATYRGHESRSAEPSYTRRLADGFWALNGGE